MKRILIILIILVVFPLSAALPGWLTITDEDNNSYYVTPHGKIYTSEKPDFVYKPVSKDGIIYYLNQGKTLINKYDPYEGLLLIKSIRYLSSMDSSLEWAGIEATAVINNFSLDQGTRFERLNKRASLLMCRIEESVHVYNEHAGTSFKWDGSVEVIQRLTHDTHLYSADSLKAGLRLPDNEGEYYDALMTFSFESFTHARIHNVSQYQKMRKLNKRKDTYTRNIIQSTKAEIVSSIEFDKGDTRYSGIEMVFAVKKGGGIVQIISPYEQFGRIEGPANNTINSVKVQ